ncbi:M48 family metalloprotease [Streptomyces sp. ST2-7A]|uniref:M48 family metalloprotease n=1 Tax=Streptomyces sp. ST2-7A TaxID=2907214 RepID=UPI001F2474DC|nr:M48 family metalloprotease [Streptomyces sp. ST2-7A]MCE7080901.1 M48 family metalloprotease [Streptomyces sp. ST2-7A]
MTAVRAGARGVLAVGLLAGFYVLAFVLVAVTAVLVVASLWMVVTTPYRAGPWALALGAGIPAVFALVHGITTVSRAEEDPPGSVPLLRADAPGLWRLIEELAERMGTPPPTRIRLTAEANAAVSEQPLFLGFLVGERTMYLGVPLLTNLREPELRAVLCHELGHYAKGHTRFGAVTHRGAASLRSTLFRLRMTARSETGLPGYAWLFQALIGLYAWLYLRLSLSVRRRQEEEADAGAVAEVGAETTAEALREVHALGFAWAGFRDRYLLPIRELGFVPDDVFGAFTAMVEDPAVRERMAELRARPVEAGRSPLDSHPPLSRRLESIGAPAPVGGRRATGGGAPPPIARKSLSRVQRWMFEENRAPATALPREQWANLAAEAFAIELAALLSDAAHALAPDGRPGLDAVLDLLERGEGERLARRLTAAPGPRDQLAEALYALVGQALVGHGLARWAPSWTEGYRLEWLPGTDRTPVDPGNAVAAAVRAPEGVEELRRELVRLGVDTGKPIPLALRTVTAPAGRTRGRTGGRMPESVAGELRRQKTVRRFTIGALAVVGVIWMVSLAGSDPSRPYTPPPVMNSPTIRTWPPAPPPAIPTVPGLPDAPGSPGTDFPPAPIDRPPLLSLTPHPVETGHVVAPGDTLGGLACRFDTTVEHLQELNDMGTGTDIVAGETVVVPRRILIRTDCD